MAYIILTFTYCPLIWMFVVKLQTILLTKPINAAQLCNLRVIYEIEDTNFADLLINDSSCTIHENNIHTLQEFIHAILMSVRRHKKLNLLIEFSNSIFIKFYFKAFWH